MNANFQPVQPLWESFPASKIQTPEPVKASGGSLFADVFRSAIEHVRNAEDVVAKAEYQLATGQLDNPAQLSLELYKANTAVSLLAQMRQKALDAYSELSRMSV